MTKRGLRFNPPPGWPTPRDDWRPPPNWTPPPDWPPVPEGWELWVPLDSDGESTDDSRSERRGVDKGDAESEPPLVRRSEGLSERIAQLEHENAALRALAAGGSNADDLVLQDDESVLQSIGVYQYRHPLENSVRYRERLHELNQRIASYARAGRAIVAAKEFTLEGSLSKGARLTSELSKLMLLAYNSEAGNCIRSLRVGGVETAVSRLSRIRRRISKFGALMKLEISSEYHQLRIEEIELTADFLMMKQEEKEAAREERARLREEKRVMKELAAERERLDKEKAHLESVLSQLRSRGEEDEDLAKRLDDVQSAIESNDFRAANIRAGHVYVVSNRGAFGAGVVKIGLTRRLTPSERIDELSGAAVPFRFDVHCLFFAEDAVGLEAELHRHFADRRVNAINRRKEFFFATPEEVRQVLAEKAGALVEYVDEAESIEYQRSRSAWPVNKSIGCDDD